MVEHHESAAVGQGAPEQGGPVGGRGRYVLVGQAELAQQRGQDRFGAERAQVGVELPVGEARRLPCAPVEGEGAGADALGTVEERESWAALEGAGRLLVQEFQGVLTVREGTGCRRQTVASRPGDGLRQAHASREPGPGEGEFGVTVDAVVDHARDRVHFVGGCGCRHLASGEATDHSAGRFPGQLARLTGHSGADGPEHRTDGVRGQQIHHLEHSPVVRSPHSGSTLAPVKVGDDGSPQLGRGHPLLRTAQPRLAPAGIPYARSTRNRSTSRLSRTIASR